MILGLFSVSTTLYLPIGIPAPPRALGGWCCCYWPRCDGAWRSGWSAVDGEALATNVNEGVTAPITVATPYGGLSQC